MRGRIAVGSRLGLAFVVVPAVALGACKSKSDDRRQSDVKATVPTDDRGRVGMPAEPRPTTGERPPTPVPAVTTPVARVDQGSVQPVGQPPPVVGSGSGTSPAGPAPASPTRIEDTQVLGAQRPPVGRPGEPALESGLQSAGSARPAPATSASGRVAIAGTQTPDRTSLTTDAVAAKIQAAYLPGLERCYQQRLAIDPTTRGVLALSFVVDATGRVTQARGTGVADALGACAATVAASWRFPAPTDPRTGTAIVARVVVRFELAPTS